MSAAQGMMPAPGPVGRNLIANVERLKRASRLSDRKLSAMLEAAGRPIPPLGLARIQQAKRRVDIDELVALAEVLGVTPDVLLAPPDAVQADHAALRATRALVARIEQLLGTSGDPGTPGELGGYVDRALRRVQIEVEELLAGTAG